MQTFLMRATAKVNSTILIFTLLVTPFLPILSQVAYAQTSTCQIYSDLSTITDRKAHLKMTGCAGVRRFQVSESPDFSHPSGIQVSLSNVATDMSAGDVTITYKNGLPGGNGVPYTLPAPHTVNALAILYEFADSSGRDNGVGAFETPTWINRFIFGDGVRGYDGYYLFNSFKDHLFQSTAGRVTLTGETYPKIVHIPLEKFRQFLTTPPPDILEEIKAAIKQDDPTYFDTRHFDFYFPLASSYYAVDRGYDGSGTWLGHLMPYDKSTSIFARTIQEVRTAFDAVTVVPLYNSGSVEGVWLASDTLRTGTNYFTGGSTKWDPNNNYQYIKLGAPLPSPNAQVIVRYMANAANSVDSSTKDTLTNSGWGSHYWHEVYHSFSSLPQMHFDKRTHIGDPYRTPSVIPGYDTMDNSHLNPTFPLGGTIDGTPLLSAVNKYEMGYVDPYTLIYGQNEVNKRLFRAEFSDVSHIQNNVTMIKVPLLKLGDPGIATKQSGIYYTENGVTANNSPDSVARGYSGEEYLLLEWRSKQPLSNNHYNFDEAVRSGGLVVYHIVETDPYGPTMHTYTIAEVIDATPPYLSGHSNVTGSAAAFGSESDVYMLTLKALWQDKPTSSTAHEFDYMLSEGSGVKTLYARFIDGSGNLLGSQTFSLSLDSDQVATDRQPSLTLTPVTNGYTTGDRRLTASYTAPNGATTLYFYMDSELAIARSLSTTTGSELYTFNDRYLLPGTHTIKAVLYDHALIKRVQTATYTGGTATGPEVTLLIASPSSIAPGQSTTLWWNSTNASACTGNGFTAIGTKGTALVTPSTTTTYSIFCTGSSGTSPTVQATVTVTGTTADTSAPTVVISIPQGGATVSGTIPISAIASDNIGVTKVEFYKDGSLHSTNTVAPYTATWDTTLSPNGSHTLSAKAYDTAGNMGVSSSVVVTVSNSVTPPPDTTAPSIPTGLSGSAVSTSQVNLSWSASTDAVGVAGYNIYRNDTKVAVPAVTTYSDTGLSAATAYGYSVSAYDVAGNTSSTTATVTVTTQSVSPPAVIAIGARVKTMATVNVRNKPSMTKSSKVLGTQSVGALGTVIGGPTVNSGYTWWQVNFDSGKDGWVAANYLVLASTASASITQSLAAGSRGVEVSLLQKILMSLGLFTTDITGYFGPITTAAVIEFQSANNLPPIGIVGPKTRARLQQVANQ